MTTNQNFRLAGAAAYDVQSLEQLKLQAKRAPDQAVGAAAKQFEALFVNMVLKSMREATPQDGLFDNEQSRMYTSMLDQQLAQHMSSRGIGLAAALTRQLSAPPAPGIAPDAAADPVQPGVLPTLSESTLVPELRSLAQRVAAIQPVARPADANDAATYATLHATMLAETLAAAPAGVSVAAPAEAPPALPAAAPMPLSHTRDFVNRVWSHAVDAARAVGIPARFMVGQAALESGWGRHEIRAADGTPSHNVFGIKAGRSWKGPVVEKTTTEYVNGVAQKVTAKFRAYASYSESFNDYAKLLRDNPRYAGVLGQAQDAKGFAHGLQKSGYATDPAYADKLTRIINGSTLRQSLTG